MKFNLKKMCANCPFRSDGAAIQLAEGRLEGIKADLLTDDYKTFMCHKTVHGKNGGEWDEEGEDYRPSGSESACVGALAFLYREGRLPILARLALMSGDLTEEQLQ